MNVFTPGKVHPHPLSNTVLSLVFAHLLFCLPEKVRGLEKDWRREMQEMKDKNTNKIVMGSKGRKDGNGRWKAADCNTRVEMF